MPQIDTQMQYVLTLITVAYLSGAVSTQFALPGAFLSILYLASAPLLYRLVEQGGAVGWSLGMLLVVFVAFIHSAALRLRRMLVASLRLGFENQALAASLREEKRAADELNRALLIARNEAEASSQAKSDFLANVGHEIRTPMNAIVGMSHLALQEPLTTRAHDYVEKVSRAAGALQVVIGNMLDFSRLTDGRLQAHNETFHLRRLFADLEALLAPEALRKDLELTVRVADEVPDFVHTDRTALSRVLQSLIGNALKFTAQGSVSVEVEMQLDASGALLLCRIADTGIGMSRQQIAHMCESLGQGDASTTRAHGGTGLGLALSCRLVRLMGGSLEADSELGEGSVFTVKVPVARAHAVSPVHAAETPEVVASAVPAAPEAACQVLEPNEIESLLNQLAQQLQDFDTEAEGALDALRMGCVDDSMRGVLNKVAEDLARYDFEAAQQHLSPLLKGVE